MTSALYIAGALLCGVLDRAGGGWHPWHVWLPTWADKALRAARIYRGLASGLVVPLTIFCDRFSF